MIYLFLPLWAFIPLAALTFIGLLDMVCTIRRCYFIWRALNGSGAAA